MRLLKRIAHYIVERVHARNVRRHWGGRAATRAELVAVGALCTHCFAQGAALADGLHSLDEIPDKPDGSKVTPFDVWPLAPHVEETYERTLNSVLALWDGREPDLKGDGLKEAYATAQATILETSRYYGPTTPTEH